MPAIITDNLKIQNCNNFISSLSSESSCYYSFIGYSNSELEYSDWNNNTPPPIDNFNYLNSYKETILGVKKITSSNVIRAIPKIEWVSGTRYDMYRHDYSSYNRTPNSNTTRLYDSNYYVVNSQFKVYICVHNGSSYINEFLGVPSTIEPTHTDPNEYVDRGDGYVWKYLYTISPSDYLKFDSTNYIPVPNNWNTSTSQEISSVRDSAISGSIRAIVLESPGKYVLNSDPELGITCNILGDGSGGTALVKFDSQGNVLSAEVTNPGSGYTYATLDLDSVVSLFSGSQKAVFTVVIPPPGGHGYNIYNELGAFRCLVYSRIENLSTNPDFIEGNQFSRVGIIKDITSFGSSNLFNSNTGSAVYGLVLSGTGLPIQADDLISQASTGAKGYVVSIQEIGTEGNARTIVKYIQTRNSYVDTYSSTSQGIEKTFDPFITNPDFNNQSVPQSYTYNSFDTSSVTINGNGPYSIVSIGQDVDQYLGNYLGQSFTNGLSNPEINTKSGDILYVDNRATITRTPNQREDIKVIIEF